MLSFARLLYIPLVAASIHCNIIGFRIAMETRLWVYLWRCFQKGRNEKGSLRMGLCVNEKQKASIRYPLLPDCGLSVTSHIIFLLPWRPPLGGAKINSALGYFSQLVMATGNKQYTYTPGYICVEKFSGKWEPWAEKKFTKPWSRGGSETSARSRYLVEPLWSGLWASQRSPPSA